MKFIIVANQRKPNLLHSQTFTTKYTNLWKFIIRQPCEKPKLVNKIKCMTTN